MLLLHSFLSENHDNASLLSYFPHSHYDCVNRLVQITAPDGIVVKRYVYDAHGNITKEIDGEGYIHADNDKDRKRQDWNFA